MKLLKSKAAFYLYALIGLSFLIHLPVLQNQTTNWDDPLFLQKNTDVLNFNLVGLFTHAAVANYYPLSTTSLALDNWLCGPAPACFHASALTWHTLNTCLVFFLGLWLFANSCFLAFVLALLFNVHPMQVEAIAWISARNHLVEAAFFLGSMLFYFKFLQTRLAGKAARLSYFFCYLFFLLALLSKSIAVILPAVFLLQDYFINRKIGLRNLIEKLAFAPPVIAILFVTWKVRAAIEEGPIPDIFGMGFLQRSYWGLRGIFFYLGRILFPHDLSPYYDIRTVPSHVIENGVDIAVSLIFILLVFFKRKSKLTLFSTGFFLIGVFPILKVLVPFGEYSIFNDRYVYLPLLSCFIFLLGLGKKWIPYALLATVPLLAYLTFQQLGFWYNGESLWSGVLERDPHAAVAHNNLGRWYYDLKDYARAEINFKEALKDEPRYAKAYYNLGLIDQANGHFQSAIANYNQALKNRPNYPQVYNNLGYIYMNVINDRPSAIEFFRKAIAVKADYPEAYYNLAYLMSLEQNLPAAIKILDELLEQWPDFELATSLKQELEVKLKASSSPAEQSSP